MAKSNNNFDDGSSASSFDFSSSVDGTIEIKSLNNNTDQQHTIDIDNNIENSGKKDIDGMEQNKDDDLDPKDKKVFKSNLLHKMAFVSRFLKTSTSLSKNNTFGLFGTTTRGYYSGPYGHGPYENGLYKGPNPYFNHNVGPTDPYQKKATTILTVRRNGKVVIIGDGQVTQGHSIVKPNAKKIRKLADGKVIAGFAGSVADAFTLFELLEKKLNEHRGLLLKSCVELAQQWRTDKYYRKLEASLIVVDKDITLNIDGNGDVLEPNDGILAIGSGGDFALAAARALIGVPELEAEDIARRSMKIAADICIYTNHNFIVEVLDPNSPQPTTTTPTDSSSSSNITSSTLSSTPITSEESSNASNASNASNSFEKKTLNLYSSSSSNQNSNRNRTDIHDDYNKIL
ncbi:hypothetical protein DLAC_11215 [Tieghemostelium lacteum]|uniref:Uncharacterized protein n=1 Tax=Tieghemostelium lacteum TaxID=361077 RepID=A0A151Z3G6_TIELA|nr:hypothetical protein DLAC_11215 [Tieghemostelium lacteum]|eukprot:KYQ88500.1 hypothetical protein DLAC_11215 [Tieghemostelium lacteum]